MREREPIEKSLYHNGKYTSIGLYVVDDIFFMAMTTRYREADKIFFNLFYFMSK